MHCILLEVVDAIGNFISGGRSRLLGNSFSNSLHLLAIGAARESVAVDEWSLWEGVPLGDLSPLLRRCAARCCRNFSNTPLGPDTKRRVQGGLYYSARWHDGGGRVGPLVCM